MDEYRELIGEDIAIFKRLCHKLDAILSLNVNGKFIISQEKIKGLEDMSKYFLGKRIQEINALDSEINALDSEKNTLDINDNN